MKNGALVIFGIFLIFFGCSTPSDQIILYSQNKFGENFEEGKIDLAKVFNFDWDTMYIFYPLVFPEDIEKDTGIPYDGGVVPDDTYLFLFVNRGEIVKKYNYGNTHLTFDQKFMGPNSIKIPRNDAKFLIKLLYNKNYQMTK